VKDSVGGLMDEAVDPQTLERIKACIAKTAVGAIEAHDLQTRPSGPVTFIQFHLVVPASMTVTKAHDICDRIENALRDAVPGSSVTIHVEPEHKAKHAGIILRSARENL
jgi:divalent metal cation (Fe/Co/Zn/Cd) transporter